MATTVTAMEGKGGYRRFWALLREMPGAEKDELVYQFTNGRTTHLHLMTDDEYSRMVRMMDGIVANDRREELRKRRRICLKLLQEIGVDTSDWDRVNAYCSNARIAGKAFNEIDAEGLKALAVKLRAILRKDGRHGLHRSGSASGRTQNGRKVAQTGDAATTRGTEWRKRRRRSAPILDAMNRGHDAQF